MSLNTVEEFKMEMGKYAKFLWEVRPTLEAYRHLWRHFSDLRMTALDWGMARGKGDLVGAEEVVEKFLDDIYDMEDIEYINPDKVYILDATLILKKTDSYTVYVGKGFTIMIRMPKTETEIVYQITDEGIIRFLQAFKNYWNVWKFKGLIWPMY